MQVFDAATSEHRGLVGAAGQFNAPFALALVDGAEAPVLLVSEPYHCRVSLVHADTGQHMACIGSRGAGAD